MNYQFKTLIQLKEICKKKSLNGYSKLNKQELIQLIQNDSKKKIKKYQKLKINFKKEVKNLY